MSHKIPTFAVIGRVNEGKSSVVSCLVEDDSIVVGQDPGTTTKSEVYNLRVHGAPILSVIDTPGFEQPEAVLAWLKKRDIAADKRPARVREFLDYHRDQQSFQAEQRLLQAILEQQATILYVVSNNHPFRASYESEMEILRWTGAPRMALINRISDEGQFTAEWQTALDQFFSSVQILDAQRSRFSERLELLKSLQIFSRHAYSHIAGQASSAMQNAIERLVAVQEQRWDEVADAVCEMLCEALWFRVDADGRESSFDRSKSLERFHDGLRSIEQKGRVRVETILGYRYLDRKESEIERAIFNRDLFSEETWEFLGQSKARLIVIASLAGGSVGGLVDLKTVGTTGLLATPIGMGIGALGAILASSGSGERQLFGIPLAANKVRIGPHQNPNFGWVLLDRALLHIRALLARTHAVRGSLLLSHPHEQSGREGKVGLVSQLGDREQLALSKVFSRARRDRLGQRDRVQLKAVVRRIITIESDG